jgi:two-component system sensor histidine kinase ChvG
MRWRRHSLRSKVVVVALAMLVLPPVFVWLSSFVESGVSGDMRARTAASAREVAEMLESWEGPLDAGALRERVEAVASRERVRIRVALASGRLLADVDREAGHGVAHAVGGFFFGPDGAPTLADVDSLLPPLELRDETIAALEQGEASACRTSPEHKLLVCHGVARADLAGGPAAVAYAQESSRRAIRSLYDLRYQLIKLTLFMLPVGLTVALAIGWWLVRPVYALRRAVIERANSAAIGPEIDAGRRDEIGDLAAAFNTLLRALRERTRENEAFLADLAHEFKNPVAAIRAGAERLSEADGLDARRAHRLGNVIGRSATRLDQLVTEFLELARAEAGSPNETREQIDLAELVGSLVAAAREGQRFADVTFELEAPAHGVAVHGVGRQLETAVRNLIDNAASFAGSAGHVRVAVEAERDDAMVRVSDDGPGIPAEELPKVFDRFYTTRGEGPGTGLGLALTKAIIEGHGGRVSVSSTPGAGATFSITVPRSRPAPRRS